MIRSEGSDMGMKAPFVAPSKMKLNKILSSNDTSVILLVLSPETKDETPS